MSYYLPLKRFPFQVMIRAPLPPVYTVQRAMIFQIISYVNVHLVTIDIYVIKLLKHHLV